MRAWSSPEVPRLPHSGPAVRLHDTASGRLVETDPEGPALVMVSHHVEEIPTGITHALLLRGGRVVEAGPIEDVLTRRGLSACFGLPLAVEKLPAGRYAARIAALAG